MIGRLIIILHNNFNKIANVYLMFAVFLANSQSLTVLRHLLVMTAVSGVIPILRMS